MLSNSTLCCINMSDLLNIDLHFDDNLNITPKYTKKVLTEKSRKSKKWWIKMLLSEWRKLFLIIILNSKKQNAFSSATSFSALGQQPKNKPIRWLKKCLPKLPYFRRKLQALPKLYPNTPEMHVAAMTLERMGAASMVIWQGLSIATPRKLKN
jgi:hypothetical protein